MRIGFNPNKDQKLPKSEYFHQIIVPVHIPNQDGYFRDSFNIFKISLKSLLKTINKGTFITIVENGSCKEVSEYLFQLKARGIIHELIQTAPIGKLNSILKGLSGHEFSLITIADADVLFLSGWQEATYELFENFPKAGAVSPVPSSKLATSYTENIICSNIFSKKLKFTKVQNQVALKSFAKSIGNESFYKKVHLEKYLTLERNKVKAVLGAPHFVCTYRDEIFSDRNLNFSPYSLGGDSERKFLDKSVIDRDFWRLSTEDNFALHMGNVQEDWMEKSLQALIYSPSNRRDVRMSQNRASSLSICSRLCRFLLSAKSIRSAMYKYKGLEMLEASKY